MSCRIYIIEDINGLKYVGQTTQSLNNRLSDHKSKKDCSSVLLDLDNCEIKILEVCPIHRRNEVEQYWIDLINCVNKNNSIRDWEKRKEQLRNYRKNNLLKLKKYKKNYLKYQSSWGGDLRADNNNLLKIDITLFQ